MDISAIKKMINIGKNFYDRGWLYGTSGNISVRTNEGIILTASGVHKGYLTENDFILIDIEGNILEGNGKPSGETDFHLQLYKNFVDVNSVIHTHSVYSSLVSSEDEVVFKDNELMKAFDGIKDPNIPIKISVFPNIQQKSEVLNLIDKGLAEIKYGYLLKNHGLFSFSSSLEKTQIYTEAFEFLFMYEYLKQTNLKV